MPNTSAPSFAAGNAVVPSPQPRSSTFVPFVMPSFCTSASPLSRIVSAMRVKSPFSQSALFGFTGAFINATISLASRGGDSEIFREPQSSQFGLSHFLTLRKLPGSQNRPHQLLLTVEAADELFA